MPDEALLRFVVQELIHRYADAINHNDWAAYRDCWAVDGVFVQADSLVDAAGDLDNPLGDRPANLQVVGREDITTLVMRYGEFDWAFQVPTAVVVTPEAPDRARVRHLLQIHTSDMYTVGFCYDLAVREDDGVWRLARREYRPSYFERPHYDGVVCRSLPDPRYAERPVTDPLRG